MSPETDHLWSRWKALGCPDLLVAVSGGGDSVALAAMLAELQTGLARSRSPRVCLAHLDHGLRAGSRQDADLVRALSDQLGLDLLHHRLSESEQAWVRGEIGVRPPEGISTQSQGLQARARCLRRSLFFRWAEEQGLPRVAWAHHRDDQAETFLIQLVRGTRPQGMREAGPGPSWRPLLELSREQLRDWLRARGLAWREDPSNGDSRFLRAAVRGRLLPLLEELRPGVTGTLARRAHWQAQEEELLSGLVAGISMVPRKEGGWLLREADLVDLPAPSRIRLLARSLEQFQGIPSTGAELVAAEEILQAQVGSTRSLSGGGRLLRVSRGLALIPEQEPLLPEQGFSVSVPGEADLPELGIRFRSRCTEGAQDESGAPNLLLRHPREGDRFRPRSLQGASKRLARYLRDRGLDRDARTRVILIVAGDRILWVVGQEPAWEEEFRASGLELEFNW